MSTLVLTRRHDEGILIGDHTIVTVTVRGRQIRLVIHSNQTVKRLELVHDVPDITPYQAAPCAAPTPR